MLVAIIEVPSRPGPGRDFLLEIFVRLCNYQTDPNIEIEEKRGQ